MLLNVRQLIIGNEKQYINKKLQLNRLQLSSNVLQLITLYMYLGYRNTSMRHKSHTFYKTFVHVVTLYRVK